MKILAAPLLCLVGLKTKIHRRKDAALFELVNQEPIIFKRQCPKCWEGLGE